MTSATALAVSGGHALATGHAPTSALPAAALAFALGFAHGDSFACNKKAGLRRPRGAFLAGAPSRAYYALFSPICQHLPFKSGPCDVKRMFDPLH